MINKRQKSQRQVIKIEKVPWFNWSQGIKRNQQGFKKIYWLKCLNCRKKFNIPAKRYNQGVGKYCSAKCGMKDWTGEGNPNWKGGLMADKNRITHFQRKQLLDKRGYVCENCGFNEYKECLEVHHMTSKHLIILCANCHLYFHVTGKLP